MTYDVGPFVKRIYNTPTFMIVAEGDDLTLWDLEIGTFNEIPSARKKLHVLPHTSLRAPQMPTKEENDAAIALFDRALKIDPNEADALAGRALAYARSKQWGWTGSETDNGATIQQNSNRPTGPLNWLPTP